MLSSPTAQFPPTEGRRHASLDLVAASNAIPRNFANNGQRNSIQLTNLCAMRHDVYNTRMAET